MRFSDNKVLNDEILYLKTKKLMSYCEPTWSFAQIQFAQIFNKNKLVIK